MSLIEYRDLCIGYEHKIIIRNINLQIESGDYVCVFGDNGIGKTTFLKTTLGLLPPVRGHVIRHPNLNRKMIGYLPQHTKVKTDFPACLRLFPYILSVLPKSLFWLLLLEPPLLKHSSGFHPF